MKPGSAPVFECPQCHQSGRKLFSVGDLNRKVSDEQFNYYRCRGCGLTFLAPVPLDLGAYYPPAYHEIPQSTEDLRLNSGHEVFKIDTIKAHASGRRLLEIGPSYGRFAFLAKSAGFEVDAFEMDRNCCDFLNNTVGIRAMHTTDLLESVQHADQYDVIAMWHSLEHLSDPWPLLDVLASRLNPGGILVIASPNPNSLQFRVLGKFWVHLDAPRHVELIPPGLLTQRLIRTGLKRVHFTTFDQGAKDCNGLGWHVSPNHRSAGRPLGPLGRFIELQLIRAGRRVEKIPGLGSAYTLVFRKT